MLAKPDPATFQLMPVGDDSAGNRADVLRTFLLAGRVAVLRSIPAGMC